MWEDDDVEEIDSFDLKGHIYIGIDKVGEKYEVYLGSLSDKTPLARFKTELMARKYFDRLKDESKEVLWK